MSQKTSWPQLMTWHKAMLLITCLLALLASGSKCNPQLDVSDSQPINYLPDCTANERTKLNLFVVSTLDGKISVIDAVSGQAKWSKSINGGPLLSSSINEFILYNKGEIVRVMPSLDGKIFLQQGNTIKQTPFTAEKLLRNSVKFSENTILVGGQESQLIAFSLLDGSVVYECGFKGCLQHENLTYEDVVLVKTTSQSIRAVNLLSGKEEWHFVVNEPQLVDIAKQQCHDVVYPVDGVKRYNVDFKVVIPLGFIYSSVYTSDSVTSEKKLHKLWKHKFDSPIVSMWHYEDGQFQQVNLFDRKIIDINEALTDEHHHDPQLYLGSYNKQLYLQKSRELFQESATNNQLTIGHDENTYSESLTEENTSIVKVEWKQPVQDVYNNSSADDININISTKSVFSFSISNRLNSTGYYIFKSNHTIENDQCDVIVSSNEDETVDDDESDTLINESIEAVTIVYHSLSYYWKEIMLISFLILITFNVGMYLFFKYTKKCFTISQISDQRNNDQSQNEQISSIDQQQTTVQQEQTRDSSYNSRFLQDFELIEILGKGGFGLVFEAKHKIDEGHYAVKRVRIPAEKNKQDRFMREIRALSKLDHVGIVRYYNAWIEQPPIGWQEQQDQLLDADITSADSFRTETQDFATESANLSQHIMNYESNMSTNMNVHYVNQTCQSSDSLEIVFQQSSNASCQLVQTTLPTYNGQQWDSSDCSDKQTDNSNSVSQQHSSAHNVNVSTLKSKKSSSHLYVYIQMQLCQKETLKDWLFENKRRDKVHMLRLFVQLIEAVKFVHANNLIHRDLKPSNIFFSKSDGLIKIGDFGLATNTSNENNSQTATESSVCCTGGQSSHYRHTNHVGTQLYMSPEQLNNQRYNHKVDIFSMGIILYELLESFNTEFERVQTLNSVRTKHFPAQFTERNQLESQLLQKLLAFKPDERPEAHELLKESMFDNIKSNSLHERGSA